MNTWTSWNLTFLETLNFFKIGILTFSSQKSGLCWQSRESYSRKRTICNFWGLLKVMKERCLFIWFKKGSGMTLKLTKIKMEWIILATAAQNCYRLKFCSTLVMLYWLFKYRGNLVKSWKHIQTLGSIFRQTEKKSRYWLASSFKSAFFSPR